MITIEQDVSVKYIEVAGLSHKNSKSNVVFLENLSFTKDDSSFVKEIHSISDLEAIVDQSQNESALHFAKMFFSQAVRPRKYYICAAELSATRGVLISGNLEEFSGIRKKYEAGGEYQDTPFAFKIDIGTESDLIYEIKNSTFRIIPSYGELCRVLNELNGGKATFHFNPNLNSDQTISITTKRCGKENGNISWAREFESETIEYSQMTTGSLYVSDNDKEYESFVKKVKEEAPEDAAGFVILGKEYTINVGYIEDRFSFEDVAEYLGYQHMKDIDVSFDKDSGSLIFKDLNASDKFNGYMTGAFADLLKGTEDTGATLKDKTTTKYTCKAAEDLKIVQEAQGAKLIPGVDEKNEKTDIMSLYSSLLSINGVRPNYIVCSRNLNTKDRLNEFGLKEIDLMKTSDIISGFNSNFTNDGISTCILSIGTNIISVQGSSQEERLNPFKDFVGNPNSRNLLINYVGRDLSNYLDGAIVTYCAGIDWNAQDIIRNTKGLTFNNVVASTHITNMIDDVIKGFRMNCYAMVDNGMNMYRNGLTCSTGDMGYIDGAVGLNALIIDIKDELMTLLSNGRLKMNSEGSNMLYATLSDICSKYKRNGFLSDTKMTKTIRGEEVDIHIPAYSIKVPRTFTAEELNSRNFPNCILIIASTRFANTISISIKDIVNNLGI